MSVTGEVCDFCSETPCRCHTCPVCNELFPELEENGVCEMCCCEECSNPLLTPSEQEEGIHDTCLERVVREHDLAVANGSCSHCLKERATTSYIDDMGEHPVCQQCYDDHNETEAVWNEFVIEHGRRPTLIEYLEAGDVFQEEQPE